MRHDLQEKPNPWHYRMWYCSSSSSSTSSALGICCDCYNYSFCFNRYKMYRCHCYVMFDMSWVAIHTVYIYRQVNNFAFALFHVLIKKPTVGNIAWISFLFSLSLSLHPLFLCLYIESCYHIFPHCAFTLWLLLFKHVGRLMMEYEFTFQCLHLCVVTCLVIEFYLFFFSSSSLVSCL